MRDQDQAAAAARRAYRSPARQRQAEETRQRMLASARTLFATRGYAGTTVEAIAEAAGVSPKTVVAAFGSKRAMLAELVDPAAPGSHFQELLAHIRAEPDPARRIALVARLTRQAYETSATDLELLRGAGAVAPELAEIADGVEDRRWRQQERLVTFLRERGALREGLLPAEANDQLWALTSFDLYRMLVIRRRWPMEHYEAWLTATLTGLLLKRP
ncbi:MAG TPA: helix-turn-helix domain-containing protein [Ktedonobacterales bacterium]|nr:helix-turn-helix domain-containing protein [Ktedonobacterales bacterium]